MEKRILTRVGDIFCTVLKDGKKCFFQYVANDLHQLNSAVIRVFETYYAESDKPQLETIIKDAVAFYAHTILRDGIENAAWYKVGHNNEIGEKDLLRVLFGQTQEFNTIISTSQDGSPSIQLVPINPLNNWFIWHVNEESISVGKLPDEYIDTVELGNIFPYTSIIERMEYGSYAGSYVEYDVIPRKARRPDSAGLTT